MRVLSVNHLTYYVNQGILDEMSQRGYEVKILPLGDSSSSDQMMMLEKVLDSFQPDYILTPGWSVGLFDVEKFFKVIKNRVPHIYWATEDPLFFDDVSMVFAPHSEHVFSTSVECVEKYQKMGLSASTLLFGCNPRVFNSKPPKPEYQHDLILIANNYFWFSEDKNYRKQTVQDMVVPLVEHGYDIKIWGADWTNPKAEYQIPSKFHGGYCAYEETPYAYSSAKIVIGLQSVHNSVTQTSTRTFEIMGSGGFLLTCYTPSHEALFENHKHLVWSRSATETLELVDYYLKHDQERKAIAAQGQAEILAKHTYQRRLTQIEQDLLPVFKKWKGRHHQPTIYYNLTK